MNRTKNTLTTIVLTVVLLLLSLALGGCGAWGRDATSPTPDYHKVPQDETQNESQKPQLYTFVLELRLPTDKTEISDGDSFPHSTVDGELIAQWSIPIYGNTVYESVTKYFENKEHKITFRLSQHRFYMFHDCTLDDGSYYNLETCYIAVDGKYAMTANYQSLLGKDGVIGTEDDVKVVTLVYKGWLY